MSIFEYDEEKHLKNEREAGYQKGHEEGKLRVNMLILKLIETGQKDKIEKAVTDKAYQEELFKEFNL